MPPEINQIKTRKSSSYGKSYVSQLLMNIKIRSSTRTLEVKNKKNRNILFGIKRFTYPRLASFSCFRFS